MTDSIGLTRYFEYDQPDSEYDRLRLSFITTNVLNLKMLLNSVEIAFKQCVRLG